MMTESSRRPVAAPSGEADGDPARMTQTRQVARNHGDDCLRQPGVQSVGLDDEDRTWFGGAQVRVGEQGEDDIAAFTGHCKHPFPVDPSPPRPHPSAIVAPPPRFR